MRREDLTEQNIPLLSDEALLEQFQGWSEVEPWNRGSNPVMAALKVETLRRMQENCRQQRDQVSLQRESERERLQREIAGL